MLETDVCIGATSLLEFNPAYQAVSAMVDVFKDLGNINLGTHNFFLYFNILYLYRLLWHLQVAHGLFEHALFKIITNAKFPLWNEIFSIHPMPECMVNSNTVNVSLLSLITCKIIS